MSIKTQITILLLFSSILTASVPREFISARSYGMGGTFCAEQGDPSSTLYNPASIATAKHTKFFSTQTTLIDEINYYGLSVVKPHHGNIWGLSLINRSVGDIPIAAAVPAASYDIDFDDYEKAAFSSGVFALTYAKMLGESFSYGLNLKNFFANTTGYDQGNASGYNLDLGFLYQFHKDWTAGFSWRDVLQGELLWDTDEVETIDSSWIFGLKSTALEKNISLLLDVKSNYMDRESPLFSTGMEWHPQDSLFIRFGVNQNLLVPEEGEKNAQYYYNYSAGIGLNVGGFRFDYAYQLDREVLDFSRHVFSFSYVGAEPADKMQMIEVSADQQVDQETVVTVSVLSFDLIEPLDRTITTSSLVKVVVQLENGDRIMINNEEYFADKQGSAVKVVPLHTGINDIKVSHPESLDEQINIQVLRIATFSDIKDSPYKLSIEQFATIGFIKEDFPDRFNPKRPLTRKEVSSIVADIEHIGIPPALKGIWQDIDLLFNRGLIKGYPGGELLPNKKISRAETAMILARLMDLNTDDQKLPGQHWAYAAARELNASGLYTMEEFLPWDATITKEEAAELFTRLPQVEQKIVNLMNFEEIDYQQKDMPALIIKQQLDSNEEYQLFQKLIRETEIDDRPGSEQILQPKSFPETTEARLPSIAADQLQSPASSQSGKVSRINIYAPGDKTIVYTDTIEVRGTVSGVSTLMINEQNVAIDADGSFSRQVKLTRAKNLIKIKVFTADGVKVYERRVLKLKRFNDLSANHPSFKTIAAMAALGYINGDKQGNIKPAKSLTRAEYAALLTRIYNIRLPNVVKAPFKDVAVDHWAVKPITAVSIRGYIKGEGEYFQPNELVSRAFGAVVISRVEQLSVPGGNVSKYLPYGDLPSGHWAAGSIYALIRKQIIKPEKMFYPSNNLKKLTAIIWLSRINRVKQEIDQLHDWAKGY